MKWFKHDSNANMDAKLKKLRIKYKMEGYGLYWYCLEIVAGTVEKHNLTFELEHDAEILANDTDIHVERIHEMMSYMIKLGLFEDDRGIVTCLKMATRTDEYTQKLVKTNGIVPTVSRQCPDSVPIKSVLIEEKRIEEKRIEEKRVKGEFTLPKSIDSSLWKEWMQIRLRLKAVNSDRAKTMLLTELDKCEKSGFDVNDSIKVAIARSWKSINPEWMQRLKPSTPPKNYNDPMSIRGGAI